ncbi:CIC family chloride channel protein [Rhodovulum iodosum]|uniref:CIC family chloride channel protein n=1 Tax=Rhodovulum iodosum TaxID=68291 RepID=A0ABV3XPK2_9RHOB|nr:chloride channel protein [Rhodovulum robiginosum]RSK37969.1 chloride channel protein [Rhodovulum robiginosum]
MGHLTRRRLWRLVSVKTARQLGKVRSGWRTVRHRGPSQIQFWFIALIIGIAAGFAALGFRHAIAALQSMLYGVENPGLLLTYVDPLAWYWVLLIPVAGGLLVGLILDRFTDDGRARSVADVIDGAALQDGRVEQRAGLASAAASLITLSSGGSTGREGPVVHMAAMISSWVAERLRADGITGRDLLGCAVAAAVSASFNAPIAGTLFALEVVLRHFAVHAFAPIAIASVAGTVVSRLEFGNVTEFSLGAGDTLAFYVELPAYLLLGLVSGLVAVILMRGIFLAEDMGNWLQRTTRMPRWLRPAVSGLALGGLAIWYPHIIGVGYEITFEALTGVIYLRDAVIFAILKAVAVALTMAGRMGGGVFSPSLMIGALTGLSFGIVATAIVPDFSGSETLYALAGMGAVAAAVLGAPISTTLIVFELTGDWQTGLAVLVAVSMSTALASRLVDRSFFLTQLERRGKPLAAGPQSYLLSVHSAALLMRGKDSPSAASEEACAELISQGVMLAPEATLDEALPQFEKWGHSFIPVVAPAKEGGEPRLLGALFHLDALRAYTRALAETAAEEHS